MKGIRQTIFHSSNGEIDSMNIFQLVTNILVIHLCAVDVEKLTTLPGAYGKIDFVLLKGAFLILL
jgi:hypothetical protein